MESILILHVWVGAEVGWWSRVGWGGGGCGGVGWGGAGRLHSIHELRLRHWTSSGTQCLNSASA